MSKTLEYQIHGDDMQFVEISLNTGQGVRAEAGAMMYMDERIEMETSTGGGFMSGFKRMVAGESFFIPTFTNRSSTKACVAFAAPYPGKIIALDLGAVGREFICQRNAFLCAAQGIEIEIAFTKKIGAGLFGGEGFILQRLKGSELAFIHAGGTIIKKELVPSETLRVDTGCLVAFAPSVDYDIQFVGGFTNALFGGEGLFFAKLTGPGTVYLQSLPFSRLADRIFVASRSGKGESKGVSGIGGGLLGGLLGGDR